MKKKQILIVVILLSLSVSGYSQKANKNRYNINWAQAERHEVRVGFGFIPILNDHYSRYDYLYGDYRDDFSSNHDSPFYGYDANQTYRGRELTCGSFNFDYTYRIAKRWELGGALSFTSVSRDIFNLITDDFVCSESKFNIGFMASARYLWMEKRYVRLYSAAALGVGYWQRNDVQRTVKERTSLIVFNGELVYFGVTVGKRLFGYAEGLFVGTRGVFKFGVGYKF